MSADGYIEYLRRRAAGGAGLIICQPVLSDPRADHHRGDGAPARPARRGGPRRGRDDPAADDPPRAPSPDPRPTSDGPPLLRLREHPVRGRRDRAPDDQRRDRADDRGLPADRPDGGFGRLRRRRGARRRTATSSSSPSPRNSTPATTSGDATARSSSGGCSRSPGPRWARAASSATERRTDDLRSAEDGGIGFAGLADIVRTVLATGTIDVLNTHHRRRRGELRPRDPDYRYGEAPNIPAVARLRADRRHRRAGHRGRAHPVARRGRVPARLGHLRPGRDDQGAHRRSRPGGQGARAGGAPHPPVRRRERVRQPQAGRVSGDQLLP